MLQLVARLPAVQLFNVCVRKANLPDAQMVAWDRLMNRIERTMLEYENREIPLRAKLNSAVCDKLSADEADRIGLRLERYKARAFIIADEGREIEITKAIRKMHVFNPIPSSFGGWSDGSYTKNIPMARMIEDPVFKPSHRSYFLQLADFVAFALLKREVKPTPLVLKYGIHKMFDETLAGVCFKPASKNDPLGIVRG